MKDLSIHSHILSNSFPTLVKAEDDIPCKRSTVKPTFTPSIHTNQQLECITLVQWTSARITRLTTFKVTRFSSSFSIPACESISTWATYIIQIFIYLYFLSNFSSFSLLFLTFFIFSNYLYLSLYIISFYQTFLFIF